MKIIYDLECNGLDPDKLWIIVAKDIGTGTVYKYSDYNDECEPLENFRSLFEKATVIIGHNILSLIHI